MFCAAFLLKFSFCALSLDLLSFPSSGWHTGWGAAFWSPPFFIFVFFYDYYYFCCSFFLIPNTPFTKSPTCLTHSIMTWHNNISPHLVSVPPSSLPRSHLPIKTTPLFSFFFHIVELLELLVLALETSYYHVVSNLAQHLIGFLHTLMQVALFQQHPFTESLLLQRKQNVKSQCNYDASLRTVHFVLTKLTPLTKNSPWQPSSPFSSHQLEQQSF